LKDKISIYLAVIWIDLTIILLSIMETNNLLVFNGDLFSTAYLRFIVSALVSYAIVIFGWISVVLIQHRNDGVYS